jgi:hypothetical protein
LHGGFDVVDAEEMRSALHASSDAGDGAGITFEGGNAEDISDDGFA